MLVPTALPGIFVATTDKSLQGNILYCCLYTGVHSLAYAFPAVKLVTTAVDMEVNDKFHIVPGIGQYSLTSPWTLLIANIQCS